jgi:histidyl-tRNA synthetase
LTDKLRAPRGTFDVLPEQSKLRASLEANAAELFDAAGYGRIETPAFEATELFSRGVGEATDIVQKEMYTFEDAGGRSITLRPEGTAPVCRAYVEHGMHRWPAPVKLWYLSSFFRYERAQAGRYRQFWQIGAEALGSDDPAVDAELIVLLATLLQRSATRELRLRVSSLGSPATRAAYREELQAYLHTYEQLLSDDVRRRIDLNPLRAFDSDHEPTREVMAGAPRLLDRLDPEDAAHFAELRALLDGAGVDYEVDATLVRGLDYYTRTVFEFESAALGAQSGVGGGGRYDGLVDELGGPPTPGVGFAAGVERILLAAGAQPPPPSGIDLFIAFDGGPASRDAAFTMLLRARQAGLRAEMELAGRSLKGQLKHADRLDAHHVAILAADGATLKDMRAATQTGVEAAAVVDSVLAAIGREP